MRGFVAEQFGNFHAQPVYRLFGASVLIDAKARSAFETGEHSLGRGLPWGQQVRIAHFFFYSSHQIDFDIDL